ncbi:hypothetical protein [Marinibactrum halimedae]|uniref:Restriction endonuclease n=1 Tax=Marinibactrum halimedae TaxID=1444977 RepID=A0AA37TC94_9GAMM|nr:hypothetical protein [Marinibactrum halimedae]GLS27656.1 hypothetical protein GCM10007877_33750 [Marinibactrum halimedae]
MYSALPRSSSERIDNIGGRELGKCWESLIVEACKGAPGYKPALRVGGDEPCDLRLGQYAIDTKYRIGSGDSGTLKKFKDYGGLLRDKGYTPILLFLRKDNLPAAITACKNGGWEIYTEQASFDFVREKCGFDIKNYLTTKARSYLLTRLSGLASGL